MRKLDRPESNFEEALSSCIDGITGNISLKTRMIASKKELLPEEGLYHAAAVAAQLYLQVPLHARGEDPQVVGEVRKSDLIKVYDQYFSDISKPARQIYDKILLSANDSCPFCGGIGRPRNLDHYLPKNSYPKYSILPANLVPVCRDCNMDGKGQEYAKNESEQVLHPYFEDKCFYTQQWVFAQFLPDGDSGDFRYLPIPPDSWEETHKKRAIKHFEDFDLAKRYAVKAAEFVCVVLRQIEASRKLGLSNDDLCEAVTSSGMKGAPSVNHWLYSMYQAIEKALLV